MAQPAGPMAQPADPDLQRAHALVAVIPDPEIPVITLHDLGILRSVERRDGRVVVTITPTYTGCPATHAIRQQVGEVLAAHGFDDARVDVTLSPPWTTDWITDDGRRKLRDYGIAPPSCAAASAASADRAAPASAVMRFVARARPPGPTCPRCDSARVERLSQYGSTPCKALYRCVDCREPFDYFKPY